MRCRLIASAFLVVLAMPAVAGARTVYGGQMNITTGERLFDDTSILQYGAPRAMRTQIDGKLRTAGMGVNTVCCRTDRQLLAETRRFGGTAVMLARPLTATERKSYTGRLLWIDGDVLVAQPGNAACAAGMTLAEARALLTGDGVAAGAQRLYAPASAYGGSREVLFGIPTKNGSDPAYGKGVRIVDEQASIRAVATDPGAIAAVAWSAARAALASGSACEVPIGGVAATEATLRNRTYPVTVSATFVLSRTHPFGAPWIRHWYLDEYVPSAKTRQLLQTARGRQRLLP